MTSYRFRRRAFITALSGGVGLKIMLRNLESSAQGTRSPGRLLITRWPVGIVAGSGDALWKPTSGSVGGSLALQPFAERGLGPDMTVIRGLTTPFGAGGAEEGGTVALVTGVAPPGTRAGQVESDDAYAGGPSFDQILLKQVAGLQRPGPGYANSIVDSRTDFGETASKTLSYSHETQPVNALSGPGVEAKPLPGVISPLAQYANLFSTFVPGTPGTGGGGGAGGAGGGAPQPVADAILKRLVGRRSVLDFSIEELNQLKRLAPSAARNKLSIHTDAVVAAEASVVNAINAYTRAGGGTGGSGGMAGTGGGSGESTCGPCQSGDVNAPSPVMGVADPPLGWGNSFSDPTRGTLDDAPIHAEAGKAHLDVLKAAFICDVIRVGTFQWSTATNHVGFALYPGTTTPYQHHPASHKINTADTLASASLTGLNVAAQFLFHVHSWYFARHAENFAAWKNAVDGCGNNLLDYTCVPFLTEVTACSHERSNMAAMIIGGKKLGFVHDRYVAMRMTTGELWGTIAQAFGYTSTAAPFAAPVAGFWTKPS
jgi:hypothetical protein